MYQHIDNSFKTPIQPTTVKLSTADGSPMTALAMTALLLRIADFKFTTISSFVTDYWTLELHLELLYKRNSQ